VAFGEEMGALPIAKRFAVCVSRKAAWEHSHRTREFGKHVWCYFARVGRRLQRLREGEYTFQGSGFFNNVTPICFQEFELSVVDLLS
jgi:hypothetical protein